jgi:hypothetical protein
MVLFDNTCLSLLLHPDAKPPLGADGNAVSRCRDRIEHLIEILDRNRTKILIPTPVLTEFLVLAGPQASKYINEINGRTSFKIVDYDQRAAIEAAIQITDAIKRGDKKSGRLSAWSKVKFDRQIIAIARVEGVTTVYSDDADVRAYAESYGISVVKVEDLPLPPPQNEVLPFSDPSG